MPFPLKPPREWFELPESEQPTPLTFEKTGKVYGHLALWGSCHIGFLNGALNECVKAPQSQTDYAHFHLGTLETSEGDIRVGKITYNGPHAPVSLGLQAASRHYDDTGAVGAFVRAVNGKLGIWLSGAVRSDIPPEGFRDLRANPPSGDWRMLRHNLELIASLSVPVPGFPIPQAQMALAASGEVMSLILAQPVVEEQEALVAAADYQTEKKQISRSLGIGRSRKYLRERSLISAQLKD